MEHFLCTKHDLIFLRRNFDLTTHTDNLWDEPELRLKANRSTLHTKYTRHNNASGVGVECPAS